MRTDGWTGRALIGACVLAWVAGVCGAQRRGPGGANPPAVQTLQQALVRIAELEAKIRKLEDELAAEKAKNNGSTPPAERKTGGALEFYSLPQWTLTRWGTVREKATKIGEPVAGAKSLRLSSGMKAEQMAPVSVHANHASTVLTFFCKAENRDKLAVATLELRGEGLFWVWKKVRPAGLNKGIERLKAYMACSAINVLSETAVLARYQPQAKTLIINFKRGAFDTLGGVVDGMKLEAVAVGAGWQAAPESDNTLRFWKGTSSFLLTLDAKTKKVTARWDTSAAGRLKEIDQQVSDWEADNKQLTEQRASADAGTRRLIDRQLATNKDRVERLKKEKADLIEKTPRKGERLTGVSGCRARIALPNGLVLYTIKVSN